MISTDNLRKLYLDFFKSKGHRIFPSDSLIPADDPSLLFTGAGMNQFKPYFLGLKKDVRRAASCQKCLRTADLDRVGKTAYHHTFFEMLGNFSFGDYFKEEAIAWGWEFVTQELRLPKEKLWVSVYEEDEEAFGIWKKKIGLSESRILKMGAVDNFWPSNAKIDGPNGPCGPCSEIHVGEVPGKGVEIWNLVFTQFNRQEDGTLADLPQKNIDTGMGLERTAAVLEGVDSNFDIDIFKAIRRGLKTLLKDAKNETAHENAAMDYARAVVFSVADGAMPSNIGRGYVIRKLIRLGSEHLSRAGAPGGMFHRLVPAVVSAMKSAYPELEPRQKSLLAVIENEEKSFLEALRIQIPRLKEEWGTQPDKEAVAFKYYDTFGLPFETIAECARSSGFSIDRARFQTFLERQKKRSRESSKITGEIFAKSDFYKWVEGLPPTAFLGYEKIRVEGARLLRILKNQAPVDSLGEHEEGILIFDKSPFYAEAGGQVGDSGKIEGKNFSAKVSDTQWMEKCIAHKVSVEKGAAKTGEVYRLSVESSRRDDIMKNHTATHLLHSALRKVLGEHVKQSGSLVATDYLRFDFTHSGAVERRALEKVETLVNAEIRKNTALSKKEMTKDEAAKEGAIAFFGEKYGDRVRVVSIGEFSKELCGGTHLESTGQIGSFKIVSESSIQAGVRRIEAVTGRAAAALVESSEKELTVMIEKLNLKGKTDLRQALREKADAVKSLRTRLVNSAEIKMREGVKKALAEAPEVRGVKFIRFDAPRADTELIRRAYAFLKNQDRPCVALFYSESDGKFAYAVGASPVLVGKGFDSGDVVKEIAKDTGGSGGGRADFALGGGKDPSLGSRTAEAGARIITAALNSILR